jgi:hypothetical protein
MDTTRKRSRKEYIAGKADTAPKGCAQRQETAADGDREGTQEAEDDVEIRPGGIEDSDVEAEDGSEEIEMEEMPVKRRLRLAKEYLDKV